MYNFRCRRLLNRVNKLRAILQFEIDGEFFKGYGNTQILDAGCTVRAEVVRHQTIMKVNCLVSGFVVTQCDRCLEDLVLKVDFEREMTVGFGALDEEKTRLFLELMGSRSREHTGGKRKLTI